MKVYQKDSLTVKYFPSRQEMGQNAAADAIARVKAMLAEKKELRAIFAAAPSQNEFLAAFVASAEIDFTRITAFHMDEYIGLDPDAPQGFGNFLRDRIFSKAPFKAVHYINGQADDPQAECARYAALLNEGPIDVVFMGIGENAHIAFNDPGVADFNDPEAVKIVPLDDICRQQQVNDGCFAKLSDVPERAITLTIPTLMRAKAILCMVPAKTKCDAVFHTLADPISDEIPASILRIKAGAVLYVDADSGARLSEVSGLVPREE